jgi:hypothetical protein
MPRAGKAEVWEIPEILSMAAHETKVLPMNTG